MDVTLLDQFLLIIRLIAYNIFKFSNYIQVEYPIIYDILYSIISLWILYKVIKFTFNLIFSTIRSIIRLIIISYIIYLSVNIFIILDSNSNSNSNSNLNSFNDIYKLVIIITKKLLIDLKTTYQILKLFFLSLQKIFKHYYNISNNQSINQSQYLNLDTDESFSFLLKPFFF